MKRKMILCSASNRQLRLFFSAIFIINLFTQNKLNIRAVASGR